MTAYMPVVYCAKCGKKAELRRVQEHKTNKRFIEARCHGETARVDFATEPNKTVELWTQPSASGSTN